MTMIMVTKNKISSWLLEWAFVLFYLGSQESLGHLVLIAPYFNMKWGVFSFVA